MRLALRDGLWVEMREHITHGEDKELRRLRVKTREDLGSLAGEPDTRAMQMFVTATNIPGLDLADPASFDRLDHDLADRIIEAIVPLYQGATVPNAPTPSSSDSGPSATS